MTDRNEAIRPVRDRMPVLVIPQEYGARLLGGFDEVLAFQQRCFLDDLIEMIQTDEPECSGKRRITLLFPILRCSMHGTKEWGLR